MQNLFGLRSDPPEAFEDLNQDGNWQEGEPFTDRNHNGKYDYGAHMKLTVAKYHLPSGRCPHREFDKEGRIVDPDWGVMPDKVVEPAREQARRRVEERGGVRAAEEGRVPRLRQAAVPASTRRCSASSPRATKATPSRYPGFDEFYQGLDTHLTEDDVRRWLRYEVRDQVSDLRGAVYPGQRALRRSAGGRAAAGGRAHAAGRRTAATSATSPPTRRC